MKTIGFGCLLFMVSFLVCSGEDSWGDDNLIPHVERQGKNLIVNPSLTSIANWSLLRDAEYDASTSRTGDGSGSISEGTFSITLPGIGVESGTSVLQLVSPR